MNPFTLADLKKWNPCPEGNRFARKVLFSKFDLMTPRLLGCILAGKTKITRQTFQKRTGWIFWLSDHHRAGSEFSVLAFKTFCDNVKIKS